MENEINNIKYKEYNSLLIEMYIENQLFLDKGIFWVSTLMIISLFIELSVVGFNLNIFPLIGFCTVIFLQVCSLKNARDGCDKSLSEKSRLKGEDLFKIARIQDVLKEHVFCLSLLLLPILVFLK